MFRILKNCTLTEKVLIGFLSLTILISTYQIGNNFYTENSDPIPGAGGTYVEGVVGELHFLNPVLAQTDLDRDVTNLVFCGLTHFDPIQNQIIDDAATHLLSADQRTYTFTLKDNLQWHDGTPVTADDVIFTFREVIQHEDFPNPALAADFFDVLITKIDDRTVTMTLKKKYAFFIYNTTVGLLPRHLLKDTLVKNLPASEFNLSPVGCGPYRIETITNSQIRLATFADYFHGQPLLNTVVFRTFQTEDQLFKNIDGVTGTKDLPPERAKALTNDARMDTYEFTLPQYVALFFNTERPILKNKNTRLGLQLATDKAKIRELIGNAKIIDTPLLEIDTSDWKYEFSAERADGALFDAGWRYQKKESTTPPKTSVTATPPATAPEPMFVTKPSSDHYFATANSEFFIEGTAPKDATAIFVNSYQLKKFQTGQTTWTYRADTAIQTLQVGENEYVISATIDGKTKEFDRAMIFHSPDEPTRTDWLASKTSVAKTTPKPLAEPEAANTNKVIASDANLIRQDESGSQLTLKLMVPSSQEEFVTVAKEITEQWHERGVNLILESLPSAEFFNRLNKRDYDIVLFGQNLGYNLDTYPFWHSSEARENGSNLSNLRSSAVNAWLEQIRSSFDSSERRKRLNNLRSVLAEEVPAILLYTPTYTFAIDKKIKNFNLGKIALKRDRLVNLSKWHLRERRELKKDVGVFTFLGWFWSNL